jgi:hypothetical protein
MTGDSAHEIVTCLQTTSTLDASYCKGDVMIVPQPKAKSWIKCGMARPADVEELFMVLIERIERLEDRLR